MRDRMARYFFHLHLADAVFPDLEGVELTVIDLVTAEDWEKIHSGCFAATTS